MNSHLDPLRSAASRRFRRTAAWLSLAAWLPAMAATPQVADTVPAADAVVRELAFVEVVFDANVTGVDAADLLVNGRPATGLQVYSPRDYSFEFTEPAAGPVQFSWAAGHGITDLESPPNAFAGGGWTCTLDKTPSTANVIVSEFLADNAHGLRDDFGDRSDWIELRNLEADTVNLEGWHLTDDAGKPTQWRFPAVTVPAGGYLLVWASGQDHADLGLPLHTNFKLSAAGEYLALLDPQGKVVSAFKPAYPPQTPDVSYGRDAADPGVLGYFPSPTPGAANSTGGPGFAPAPVFSLPGGVYTNASLSVAITAPAGTIRYTLNGTVPTATSPEYTAPLELTRSQVIHARVFQDGLLPGPVGVQTYELVGAGLTNFSSRLPLMIIDTAGRGVSADSRIPASVTTIKPFRGRAALAATPDFQGKAQIEYRGQSSLMFPKKAYNLEIDDATGADLAVPLLGLPAESDWVLYAPYTDKPFLQNFLAYERHEEMGHYAPRRRFVELFVHSATGRLDYPRDYAGIYLLVEKIKVDDHRVDIARLTPQQNTEPEVTGGYMIKKDKDSPGDRSFSTAGGGGFSAQTLKYHEPKPREITPAQRAWIRNYLVQFEKALYASDWLTRTGTNHYSYYIDVDSFVDNHWIVEFAKQIDGYRLSNYMHKDRGGKLAMDPIWDWNLSFGNADYLDGANPSGWYYPLLGENEHIWLRRLINGTAYGSGTTGDPDFNQRIADRWSELRTNVLNASNLLARVDEMAAYLDEAQVRDFKRWPRLGTYIWPNPPIYSQPRTYAEIIANLKNWIGQRYAWIDRQFVRAPDFARAGGGISPGLPLTLSAATGTVYYTLDGADPRAPGGGIAAPAKAYAGPITLPGNCRVVARVRSGTKWSGPTAATFVAETPALIVTELMYRPARPAVTDTNEASDFEFIELKNRGTAPLDLRGFQFVEGFQFAFATGRVATLAPGARVVLVRNAAAFARRYGQVPGVAGEYTGSLDNDGERLRLVGPMRETVLDFKYDPAWCPATDGLGFALVAADVMQAAALWSTASGWRTGTVPGGTPGEPEPPVPPIPRVLVNEVLAHTDPPLLGSIELFNPTATPADISGWYLTDDRRTPKFRIPAGTVLPAGGFAVFTEQDFNPTPGVPPSFALRASGDEAYLLSADAAGQLTGYVHGFPFGATLNGESLGRYVTSTGEEQFVRQAARSLGASNVGPKVGPVVIGEVMYHPPDVFTNAAYWDNTEHEFIELHNLSGAAVPLFDPNAPTNTWRLRDAVRFAFPTSTFLAAGERVLVVSFDPATQPDFAAGFRAAYGLDPGTRLFGPFAGKLANDHNRVELTQPDVVRNYGVGYVETDVLIDRVAYRDEAPWPGAADGLGFSLQRLDESAYSNDPTNWTAAPPTPGRALVSAPPPVIVRQPLAQTTLPGADVTLSVTATGTGTLRYQWRRDGERLPDATAATLTMNSVLPAQSGEYQVVVWNEQAAIDSVRARVLIATPPSIVQPPASVDANASDAVNFSVAAAGAAPLSYQWRRDGVPLSGATQATFTVAAAQATDAGEYDVLVSDGTLTAVSLAAHLRVVVDPVIVQQPVALTGARGGPVTFSVAVTNAAELPIGYQWQKNGTVLVRHTAAAHVDFLTLGNLQPGDTGDYNVAIVNRVRPLPGIASQTVHLAVVDVADTDGDGLPDDYETAHGFDSKNPNDASADADNDGATNREEFLAGTDPREATSRLEVERIESAGGAVLRFRAVANRTYSVLYRDAVDTGEWHRLAGVPAISADSQATRVVEVADPTARPPGQRFYRLVVPGQAAK